MEKAREFKIDIAKGIDWFICKKDLEGKGVGSVGLIADNGEYEIIVAELRVDKDNKILQIYDPFISDEKIEQSKKDKRFSEVVKFKLYIDDKFIKEFQGDFIKALEVIKEEF